MTIEQAIVKVYSEGWRHKAHPRMKPKNIDEDTAHALWYSTGDGFLLDPLFWQSLGKAMGWIEEENLKINSVGDSWSSIKLSPKWKWEWHRFIDHLAEGKDAESFFETL